ncbi:MAG TPA: hypothetical protein VHI51_08810 [Ktedonobacterales bacterium]|jgi:hypothetical protein|nr:hypothetical protein [Ktedonobacterales bacterium]
MFTVSYSARRRLSIALRSRFNRPERAKIRPSPPLAHLLTTSAQRLPRLAAISLQSRRNLVCCEVAATDGAAMTDRAQLRGAALRAGSVGDGSSHATGVEINACFLRCAAAR